MIRKSASKNRGQGIEDTLYRICPPEFRRARRHDRRDFAFAVFKIFLLFSYFYNSLEQLLDCPVLLFWLGAYKACKPSRHHSRHFYLFYACQKFQKNAD